MQTAGTRTRIQLKNILYTSDFSPAAKAAAPYAAELATRYGAKLYALYVRPLAVNPAPSPESWELIQEAIKDAEAEDRRRLKEEFAGLEVEILMKEGFFWSNLNAVIESKNIDFIVMGTRGLSGPAKLLMGSTAEQVFREVTCPVLAVGPGTQKASRVGQFRNILFATDFTPASLSAAPYAVSLAQEFQAKLTLIHVIADRKVGELVRAEELRESMLNRLRCLVNPEAELWCTPEPIVEEGAPAEKILDVAHRRHADLIVLGVRKASGVPGAASHLPIATAHKIVSHAACPVLTVRGWTSAPQREGF